MPRLTRDNKWVSVYAWLSSLPPGSFVPWLEYEERTGNARTTRSALTRAVQEMEKEGRFLGRRTAKGFEIL